MRLLAQKVQSFRYVVSFSYVLYENHRPFNFKQRNLTKAFLFKLNSSSLNMLNCLIEAFSPALLDSLALGNFQPQVQKVFQNLSCFHLFPFRIHDIPTFENLPEATLQSRCPLLPHNWPFYKQILKTINSS